MSAAAALVAAYALDRAFGEPPDRLHPVAWMGSAIGALRGWTLRAGRVGQLARGAAVTLLIPGVSAALAYLAVSLARPWPLATFALTVLLLKPMFAVRALGEAAFVVRDALDAGDLAAARRGLGSLCSRSAADLGPDDLIAATVESVAENTSDSVVAPLCFFACFGLPGAVFYRAVNTLDAMVGYRGRFEYAGKAAARLDDLLNLAPARVTAALLLLAGAASGARAGRGLAVLLRDGAATESPNAGRPMAAMAGLLGLRLTKSGHYALGDAREAPDTRHITAAWRIASRASSLALVLAAAATYALRG